MRRAALLCLCLALAACSERSAPPPAPAVPPQAGPARHELGRSIYNFRCYFCHGYSGDAKTLASTYLSPRPRAFSETSPAKLSRERMLDSIKYGRIGTAMRGFDNILNADEIAAVADFVRQEFMIEKAVNTRYHTAANGWPDHQRYAAAFPFANGTLALDDPVDKMTPQQRAGRRLFMASCVSCHDSATVRDPGAPWDSRPLSYPRNGFVPGDDKLDAVASATPYHLHDKGPLLAGLTPSERRGEKLFQDNCSFCHGGDGTGKNWIGAFLEPHPRDLTSAGAMAGMTRARLTGVIREGLPETSMPAWKSVLSAADIEAVADYIHRAFHPLAPEPASQK
jgi:cytochrome c oxidase cbb3-type subunit 3